MFSGATLKLIAVDVEHKSRRLHNFIKLDIPGCYMVNTQNSCLCNEQVSLYNRHMVDYGFDDVSEQTKSLLVKHMRLLVRKMPPINRWSYERVILHHVSAKRRKLEMACESLKFRPLVKHDSYIKMFVKADKFPADKAWTKPPRAIQYRSPRYGLVLQSYLAPIEHAFTSLPGLGPTRLPVLTKCLNSFQRAKLLIDKMNAFSNPVFIMIDYSKFDAHVTTKMLQVEHMFYNELMNSRLLQEILTYQLDNIGYTSCGMLYKTKRGRMSGDINTSLGNCLLNRLFLELYTQTITAELMIEGDDSIVICEEGDHLKLSQTFFSTLGLTTETSITTDLAEVEYCQSRMVNVIGDKWRFVRNPYRVMSHDVCTVKYYHPNVVPALAYTIGQCELACVSGVPVLQEFSVMLMRLGRGSRPVSTVDIDLAYRAKLESKMANKEYPITPEARDTFARAFDFSIAEQLATERYLRSLTVSSLATTVSDEYVRHILTAEAQEGPAP